MGQARLQVPCSALLPSTSKGASIAMTQEDIDEICEAFDQAEVETLYWRFRSLDKGRKGFVTAEELLKIPELSINPLAPRLVRMLDGCNYRDFVRFLAAFSSRAEPRNKAHFMFECYDVDGDGLLTADDLRAMLRYLVAGHMSDEQVDAVIAKCFEECGCSSSMDVDAFAKFVDTAAFEVAVPTRL